MAISVNVEETSSIELSDLINHIDNTLNPEVPDTILECCEHFKMLSNNREFMVDFINDELDNILAQNNNTQSFQSLLLHRSDKYYIRANVWPANNIQDYRVDELYSTLIAHDHNFSFLTVGYLGKGYETEIWEYDYSSVAGYVGEKVDMRFLERTFLPVGKVMYYRESTDIHTQFPAKEFSVSLNIIPLTRSACRKEQFWFDMNKKTIKSIVENSATGRYLIMDLAKNFGNDLTYTLLEDISESHHMAPHVRLRSYEAMAVISNAEKDIWERAINDSHSTVRKYAKLAIER